MKRCKKQTSSFIRNRFSVLDSQYKGQHFKQKKIAGEKSRLRIYKILSVFDYGSANRFESYLVHSFLWYMFLVDRSDSASRKRLCTKVTPDWHLTYSKNGGNQGLVLNDKKWKFLHKIICCGNLFESPRGGDSNR